jgi:hypothetical protein
MTDFANRVNPFADTPARRLRCSRCGNRQVSFVIQPDTRPPAMRESEGAWPETYVGLPD